MSKGWACQMLELKPSGVAGMFSFGFNATRLQESLVRPGLRGWELLNVIILGTGSRMAIFKREL